MAAKIFNNKAQKRVFIILGIVALLVLIPVLFINSYLKPVLSKKLTEAVLKGTDSLYHISYSNAELNVFRGSIVLHDIVFQADSVVYQKLKASGKAPGILYKLRVNLLSITDAQTLKAYFKKEIVVGQIKLSAPQIQISKYARKKDDTTDNDKRTLYQKLSKSLKSIQVNNISLENISLTHKDYTAKKVAISTLSRMSVNAHDLLIDSATQADTTRTLYCKDINTKLINFKWQSPGGLYNYKVKSISLSTQKAELKAVGLKMQPLAVPKFFAKSKQDRFTFTLDTLTFNNFDFRSYYQSKGLSASNMGIENGLFEVYSNPNGPLPTTDRLITFPNWAVRKLKFDLKVDTLRLKNIDVVYKEFNKDSKKSGYVKFSNATGRLLNITNNKDALKKNNICNVYIESRFMDAAKFDLSFTFNLNDADYKYNYNGHLGPMDMRLANPAVMPLGMVQITSGNLKSLDFNVSSTQKTSTGQLKFLYNNLKVNMLKQDDKKGYSKKSLLSMFANSLVLKSNNPDDAGKSPRTATLMFIRPANFPFFKTVWFTLLNGIKASAMGKASEQDKKTAEKKKEEQQKAAEKARKLKEKEDKKFKEKLEKRKQQ